MEATAAPQVCYRHCYTSFPVSWVRQKVVPLPARVSLLRGIYLLTRFVPTSKQSPSSVAVSWTDPSDSPLNSIFMLGGTPKAHEVYSVRLSASYATFESHDMCCSEMGW